MLRRPQKSSAAAHGLEKGNDANRIDCDRTDDADELSSSVFRQLHHKLRLFVLVWMLHLLFMFLQRRLLFVLGMQRHAHLVPQRLLPLFLVLLLLLDPLFVLQWVRLQLLKRLLVVLQWILDGMQQLCRMLLFGSCQRLCTCDWNVDGDASSSGSKRKPLADRPGIDPGGSLHHVGKACRRLLQQLIPFSFQIGRAGSNAGLFC